MTQVISHEEFVRLKEEAAKQKEKLSSLSPEVGKTYQTKKFDIVSVEKITKDKIVLFNHTLFCRQYVEPKYLLLEKELKKVTPTAEPKILPMQRSKFIWV